MKTERTDIVIVGAGTTGLAAAWELAKAGLDVIALDKGRLAGEGAGKSGSNIRMVGRHSSDVPLMLEAIKLWNSMSDDLGMDVGMNFCGNLWVSFSDEEQASHALRRMDVDENGLDQMDRKLLRVLVDIYGGGPVGVKTLAVACSEEVRTIEDIYEPYLIQCGFLKRTSRGRMATAKAYKHLNMLG